jgi:hypothetical protein
VDVSAGDWVGVGVEAADVLVNAELCVFAPDGSVPAESLQAVISKIMKINKMRFRIVLKISL